MRKIRIIIPILLVSMFVLALSSITVSAGKPPTVSVNIDEPTLHKYEGDDGITKGQSLSISGSWSGGQVDSIEIWVGEDTTTKAGDATMTPGTSGNFSYTYDTSGLSADYEINTVLEVKAFEGTSEVGSAKRVFAVYENGFPLGEDIIVIDPGHGVTGNVRRIEDGYTQELSYRLAEVLSASPYNYNVIVTHKFEEYIGTTESDESNELYRRAHIATESASDRNVGCFVSIHFNAPAAKAGIAAPDPDYEVYQAKYSGWIDDSWDLGGAIWNTPEYQAILDELGTPKLDPGVQSDIDFTTKHLGVLKHQEVCPAVLDEVAGLNKTVQTWLGDPHDPNDDNNVIRLANALAIGLDNFMNQRPWS